MAKRVDSVDNLDRISSLPDHILSHILSFLPTQEVIRTSVLSSRWRYLFASMPTFDFTDCLRRLKIENVNNFKNFMDRLLSFPNPLTLECFKLLSPSCDNEDDESLLYRWISVILSRGVKELVLLSTCVSPRLSSRILTSHSLVTLKLDTFDEIKVPTNVSLPNLKILHLYELTLSDDSVFRLINSCDVLEELDLVSEIMYVSEIIIQNPSLKRLILHLAVDSDRTYYHLVEINAPNLVYFHYDDDLADRYVLSDMKSLEKAYIIIFTNKEQDLTCFFQAIVNVQSLRMEVDMFTTLSRTSLEPVLAFNNLVHLHLENPSGEWVVEFLHCVPILKTLILSRTIADEGFGPEKKPSCLSFHLKEITFSSFNADEQAFDMISYFLNHALVLEKLRVTIDGPYSKIEPSMRKKLLRLAKSRAIDVSWINVSERTRYY